MGAALNDAALKSTQPLFALYPRANYNVEPNEIRPGYFSLYRKKPAQVENGTLIKLLFLDLGRLLQVQADVAWANPIGLHIIVHTGVQTNKSLCAIESCNIQCRSHGV